MEFRILGPLEVLKDRRPLSLPVGRGRALLALLVLRAGEVVSADRLIDELWGETPPPTAKTALQGLVSKLRKRLEPDRASDEPPTVLETRLSGYRLAIDPGQVDAKRFRHLLAKAREVPVGEKGAILDRALSLWRGPALTEFSYEPFAQTEIAALEELRLTATEERMAADLVVGRHGELVSELERLTSQHPLRERLREHLMLALYRSGRQVEALEVYTNTRRMLVEELGIEPGPALQQMEGAILRQNPSLDWKPAPFEVPGEPAQPASMVAPQPWLPEERRTVTVVFVDVTVSTSSGRAPDDEATRRLVARFLGTAAGVLTGHGGRVEEVVGDALVGVFGIPTAREDDALRAVRAAVDLRHALAALNNELAQDGEIRLAARAGINTGEVVVAEQALRKVASGAAVKAAARLQQAAAEGEILVGEGTRWLVQNAALLEPAASFAVAGAETPSTAWKLLDLVPGAPPWARRLDAPMVGRAPELSRLHAAYDRTVRERTAHRFTVLGEAGIGKSRLAREFATTLGSDASVLTGHCPAYGDGITFWPLREVVVEAAGGKGRDALLDLLASVDDAESIADQVAGAIGSVETPGSPDALFPALRRFFEALARERPVAVILEDVHWAQPTLLDLVEYLANGTSAPVFLLCLARPEFVEERGAWTGESDAASLVLEPLGPDDSQQLIAGRLGGRPIPAETLTRIVQTAQGNPLFAEQMLASLQEEGQVSIPASVQALLAARLDRLGPAERDLIRSASVLGIEFSLAALMPLLPDQARPFVGRHLDALVRRDLILPSPRSGLEKETFTFRHDLIQLAAYRSVTKETRAELHERVAQWFEGEATLGSEFEEIVGYHLEQAHDYRRELGPLDAHGRVLAVRAGESLASAGLRAFARFDASAAENLLSRATAVLPDDHPLRWKTRRVLADAYEVMGRHTDADAMLAELLEEVRANQDSRLEHSLRLERARIRLATGPDPTSLDAIRGEAERALVGFEGTGDETGLAQACHVLGLVHLRLGELREMEEVAGRGLAHAKRSGSAREELGARWSVSTALVTGAKPVQACIRSCRELVRWRGTENPGVLADLAVLRSMLGEVDEGRELITRARRLLVDRTRARRPLGAVARRAAEVEIIAGDLAAGERELRAALELGREMGERDQVSQIAASLSRILSMRGATEEAARFASLSADQAPAESVAAQALWRAATARVLANRVDSQEAERLVREAIQLLPLEMLNLGAELRGNLAEVLQVTGQREAALMAISEAIDLFGRKGNLAAAIQARSLAE